MKVLQQVEHKIERAVDAMASRVVFLFGGGGPSGAPSFDASRFPRSVLKQVQGRVQQVGRRSLCPHHIQLFVPRSIHDRLGDLTSALQDEVKQAIERWAEREGLELLRPVRVDWVIDELSVEPQVVVNITFGGGEGALALAEIAESEGEPSVDSRSDLPADEPADLAWGRLVGEDGLLLELRGQPLVGRERPADLLAPDATVSAAHAVFLHEAGGRCFVRDEGSSNGTWVGGRRIDGTVRLRDGDRVELGDLVFRFEEVG